MKPLLSSPVTRIGVIQNPFSTLNGKRFGVETAGLHDPDILVEQASKTDDIAQILRHFRDMETGIVVIDGGDGTVREVLSQCPAVFGDNMPTFCALPSGKTNVCAHDTGTAKYHRGAFNRLLARRKAGIGSDALRRRPVLGIEWEDGFHAPVYGMLAGFSGFRKATGLAQSRVHAKGVNHRAAVAMTILGFFHDAIFGSDGQGLRSGEPMTIRYDGGAAIAGPRFGVILTTLQAFVLGIWPFWSDDADGEGKAISWLDIAAPPPRLLAAAMSILGARKAPWLEEAGYHSGKANDLIINISEPFIIDGDLFEPGPAGHLRINSRLHVDFIAP